MSTTRRMYAAAAKSCDPIDGSPPGSSVPGILQARILEWIAISSSKRTYKRHLILNYVRYYNSGYYLYDS